MLILEKNKFSRILQISSIFVGVIMALYYFYPVFASPPSSAYAPGETTDPTCSPGDTNCTVYPPLTTTLTSSTAIIMGTSSLRLAYNAANYANLTVASDGALTVSTTGSATTTFANKISFLSNAYFATIASGTWNGSAIGLAYGGTNSSTLSDNGSVIYSDGTRYNATAVGIAGQLLQSNGAGTPVWANTSSMGLYTGWLLATSSVDTGYSIANANSAIFTGANVVTTTRTNNILTFSLIDSGITAGTYGSASAVPVFTVNAQGIVTANSTSSIAISADAITSGILAIARGGTNSSTLASNGSVIYSDGTAYNATAVGSAGQLLQSNGAGMPTWVNTTSFGFVNLQGSTPGTQQTGHLSISGTGLFGTSLGVGTTTPTARLTVQGAGTENPFSIVSSTADATSMLTVLTNGNVGINSSTPFTKLAVEGTSYFSQTSTFGGNIFNVIGSNTVISQVATTSVGTNPQGIFVSGRYAYTANFSLNTMSVVDVSNPSAPVQIASASVGTNPRAVYVSGRYAYVVNNGSANISVVDISNPTAPRQVATASVGTSVNSIFVSGRYAYVTNGSPDTMSVVDISNPLSPVQISTVAVGATPGAVYVSGRYAYVTNAGPNTVSVIDVSNPAVPVQVSTVSVGSDPRGIYVSGRYAYTANSGANNMSVIDISSSSVPVQVATVSVGTDPYSIFVSGRYAYVANSSSANISIVDVSSSTVPIQVATVAVDAGPRSVFVSGRYVYTANNGASTISVVDVSGAEVTSIIAHSAEVGNLQSRNDIFAQGNIMAGTSLLVGAGGIMSNGPLSVFASSTGVTSSIFDVSSVQTPNAFKVFANGNIGIGTSSPAARLTVQGSGTANPFSIVSSSAAASSMLTILTNGNVGINSSSPIAGLAVQGAGEANPFVVNSSTGASLLTILTNGNVGINSSSPYANLSVQGDLALTGGIYDVNATRGSDGQVLQTNGTAVTWVSTSSLGLGTVSSGTAGQFAYYTNDGITLSGTSTLFVLPTGLIGVGTTTPAAKLTVQGSGTANPFSIVTSTAAASSMFTVLTNGNVGINTSSPVASLAVQGNDGINPFSIVSSSGSSMLTITTAGSSTLSAVSALSTDPLNVLTLEHTTDGTPGVGFGTAILFRGQDGSKTAGGDDMASISAEWADPTSGSEDTTLFFNAVSAGTLTQVASLNSNSILLLNKSLNGAYEGLQITNTINNAAGRSTLVIRNSGLSTGAVTMQALSTGFTTAGGLVQDGGVVLADTDLSGGLSIIAAATDADLRFYTGGSADANLRMFMDGTTGFVGVNSSSPLRQFSVQGEVSFMGLTTNAAGNAVCVTATGTITDAGAASCSLSARQFKTNITPYTDSAVELFNKLVDVGAINNYEFKHKLGEKRKGLIADEVAKVDNDLVVYNDGAVWSLNFIDFTGLAVKAISELDDKITGLTSGNNSSTNMAQLYAINPDCETNNSCPQTGEVVCATDNFIIEKCSTASDDKIVGVVAENSQIILGGANPSSSRPIALNGRVWVNVSIANGPIQIGDYLTSSDIPGVAVKATEPGLAIGMALQSFEGGSVGTTTVSVNTGWSLGSPVILSEAEGSIFPDFTKIVLDKFTLAVRSSLRKLGLLIKDGVVTVKQLFADKVTIEQLCVGDVCVDEKQLQNILSGNQTQATGGGSDDIIIESPPDPAISSATGEPFPSSIPAITATTTTITTTITTTTTSATTTTTTTIITNTSASSTPVVENPVVPAETSSSTVPAEETLSATSSVPVEPPSPPPVPTGAVEDPRFSGIGIVVEEPAGDAASSTP